MSNHTHHPVAPTSEDLIGQESIKESGRWEISTLVEEREHTGHNGSCRPKFTQNQKLRGPGGMLVVTAAYLMKAVSCL